MTSNRLRAATVEGFAKLICNNLSEDRHLHKKPKKLLSLEHDVLWRLSVGDAMDTIADDLELSENTIGLIVMSATKKLGANNVIHAVSVLLRNGQLGVTRG